MFITYCSILLHMVTFCKARTVARGEKIFHAPRDAEGYFECTEKRDEDGILKEVVFRKYEV